MVKSDNGDENYMVLVSRKDGTAFLDIVTCPEGGVLAIFAWVKHPYAQTIDYMGTVLKTPFGARR